jgi:hypothetical protein
VPRADRLRGGAHHHGGRGAIATTDFYSDIGHRLAAAKVIPASGVPGASAGSGAAQGMIGSIKAICHDVGAAVHWAQAGVAALPAGSSYSTFCNVSLDMP